jgi:exopolysaccharide biosynthesis WecB/TagA/CpsF family protein
MSGNKKIRILNVDIDNISRIKLLDTLKKGVLLTPNVDDLIKNQYDKEFHECVLKASHVICDSKIVLLASKFLGDPLKEAIPGSGFFSDYYKYNAKNKNIKIFLLGAKEGVGAVALEKINSKIKREIIVGYYSPPFGFENDHNENEKILSYIKKSDANVVLVGLGNPKQTKWIFKYKDQLPDVDLFMALGATIDFEAGNIMRAPVFMQRLSLEWLYRLFKEPKRLWRRYLIDDIPFFLLILKQRLRIYKDPFE